MYYTITEIQAQRVYVRIKADTLEEAQAIFDKRGANVDDKGMEQPFTEENWDNSVDTDEYSIDQGDWEFEVVDDGVDGDYGVIDEVSTREEFSKMTIEQLREERVKQVKLSINNKEEDKRDILNWLTEAIETKEKEALVCLL